MKNVSTLYHKKIIKGVISLIKNCLQIRTDDEVIERFKKMAKEDKRKFGDFLMVLMDNYEKKVLKK